MSGRFEWHEVTTEYTSRSRKGMPIMLEAVTALTIDPGMEKP